MEENEPQFDFSALLNQLTLKITAYTEICLLALQPHLIHFKITWILTAKHKNYRIICTPKQAAIYIRMLRAVLHRFPIRKIALPFQFMAQHAEQEDLAWQEIIHLVDETHFDEIVIDKFDETGQQFFNRLFGQLTTKKIKFTQPFIFDRINLLVSKIHLRFPERDLNLCLHVDEADNHSVKKFVENWTKTLLIKPQIKTVLEKKFGYPFPLPQHLPLNSQRREQISIYCKEKEILTVRQLNNLGCGVILKGNITQQLLNGLTKILSLSNRFISLELEALQSTTLVNFVAYIIQNLHQSKYHISIGHQIQLTTCRLVLNTTGLTREEVKTILELMKHPGHYELICYSSAEHFPAAVELFRHKPLIKFNFFLSMEEFESQRQILIKRMEKHADQLMLKVYSYAGLLKNMAGEGYLAVNTIFYTLGDQP